MTPVPRETLRIACPITLAHEFLREAVTDFLKFDPGRFLVTVSVTDAETAAGEVASGQADIGLTPQDSYRSAEISLEPIKLSTARVFLPVGHRLAHLQQISPRDIGSEPLATLMPHVAKRRLIDSCFEDAGIAPNIIVESNSVLQCLNLIKSGLCVGVLNSFPEISEFKGHVISRNFTPTVEFSTSLVWPSRGHSKPAALEFASFVRERVGQQRPE